MSDAVLVALIVGATTITNGVIAIIGALLLRKVNQTHDLVNGMSHELAKAQTGRDRAEGFTEGEAAQRERQP